MAADRPRNRPPGSALGSTLAVLGAACVVAAIVGGGFTAAGSSFPIINSLARQVLLAAFGLVLLVVGWLWRPTISKPGPPRMTVEVLRHDVRARRSTQSAFTSIFVPIRVRNRDAIRTLELFDLEIWDAATGRALGSPNASLVKVGFVGERVRVGPRGQVRAKLAIQVNDTNQSVFDLRIRFKDNFDRDYDVALPLRVTDSTQTDHPLDLVSRLEGLRTPLKQISSELSSGANLSAQLRLAKEVNDMRKWLSGFSTGRDVGTVYQSMTELGLKILQLSEWRPPFEEDELRVWRSETESLITQVQARLIAEGPMGH